MHTRIPVNRHQRKLGRALSSLSSSLPLLFMLFGIIQVGIAFNNDVELTDAVRTGGRNLAISRATASGTPYTPAP